MGGGSVGATGQFNFSVEEAYLMKWQPHKTPEEPSLSVKLRRL